MKNLLLALFAIWMTGCDNMNRSPDGWITVINSKNSKPVKGLPIVYIRGHTQGLFGGMVLQISREYITNSNGLAYVPLGENFSPATPSYTVDYSRQSEMSNSSTINNPILYVKPTR